ncbi:hypothetical protein L208DRAFT_1334764, partial [Tricholoma matsutake]
VVVINGVTIGCPCCVIHNCTTPLANNRYHFCPKHSAQNFICAIISCDSPAIPDCCTCLILSIRMLKRCIGQESRHSRKLCS